MTIKTELVVGLNYDSAPAAHSAAMKLNRKTTRPLRRLWEKGYFLDEQTITEHGLGVSLPRSSTRARGGLYGRTMQAKWALRSASADTTWACAGRANEMETAGSARKWEANAESGPPSLPPSLSLCPTFISYAYMHALSARPTVSRAVCLSAHHIEDRGREY